MPWDEGFSLARNAANEAMAIDKNSAAAHAALGYIAAQHDNNLTVAAKHYERALALEPTDPDIIFGAATFVQNLGRQEDAIALREYLVSVDPVRSNSHYNLGYSYLSASRWDDAIASFGIALRLNPDSLAAHYLTGIAFLLKGESRSSLEEMRLESFEPVRMIGLVVANFAVGQVSRSNSLIDEVTDKYPDWAYNFSQMHAFRNENDRAFDWLEKAIELRDPGLSEIVGEVMLTNLHDDPRWLPLLDSIGKSRSQLDAVRIRVSIPNQGD
jgi:tetratricopeptide (TPR) repeat protein